MAHEAAYLWLAESPEGAFEAWSDAPLPVWRDELGAGPGEIRAKLPRIWTAAGVPGDARDSDDLVLEADGGTAVSIYKLDQGSMALPPGAVMGAFAMGAGVMGNPPFPCEFIYRGTLDELTFSAGGDVDETEFVLLPAHSLLTSHFDDVIAFVDTDPVDIARHFFDAGYLPTLTWDPRNPTSSGRTVTQAFQYQTYKSILDFCVQVAGAGWYMHTDERGQFRLWAPDTTTPTHIVQVSREIIEAQYTLTRALLRNQVIVRGKGATEYSVDAGSLSGATVDVTSGSPAQPVFGGTVSGQHITVSVPTILANAKAPSWTRANARSVTVNMPNVSDQATADLLAALLLDRLYTLSARARLRLVSNDGELAAAAILFDVPAAQPGIGWYTLTITNPNLSPTSARGYDLESVKPGDTVQLWLDEPDPTRFVMGAAAMGTVRMNGGQVGIVQTPQVISATSYNGGDTLDIELSNPQPSILASQQQIRQLVEQALGAAVAA